MVRHRAIVATRAASRILVVPMATTERDYYEVLGVERTATDAEIKRAFRKLAQQWHPDVNTDPAAQERFKEINEAYQVLSDPERRQRYDMFGRAGVDGAGGPGGAGFEGFGGFSDIFDAFFGGGRGAGVGPARPAAARRRPALRPADHLRGGRQGHREGDRVHRPPGAARRATAPARKPGTEPTTCPQCNGRGEVRSRPPDDARPDGQRQRLPALPRRGQDRRDAVRHVPRRRPDRAQADAPGHDPGRHRRGPPDPPLERGRGRAARRPAGQPVRRRPRPAPPVADARGDRALLRGRRSRSPRRRSGRGSRSRPSTARRRSRSSPAPSRTPRSGCAARACRTSAGRASAATSTSWSTSSCRPSSRRRPRELLDGLRRGGRRAGRRTAAALLEKLGLGLTEARAERTTRGVGRLARAGGRGRPRGGRGGQRDPRPGRRPAGRRSSRRSSSSTRGSARGVDPTRPAIVRAYVPGARPGGRRPGRRRGRRGARPPPGVRAAADRRAPDADRRRGRLGRGLEGVLPGHARRPPARHPADLAASPPRARRRRPRARPGDGVRDRASIRRPGCASPRSRRWPTAGVLAGARVLDVGCGSGILAIAAVRLGRRRRSASTPTRSRSRRPSPTPAGTGSSAGSAHATGSLPSGEAAVRCRARQPDRRACSCPLAPAPARRAPTGRRPARVGDLRRPRRRGPRGVRGGRARRSTGRDARRATGSRSRPSARA